MNINKNKLIKINWLDQNVGVEQIVEYLICEKGYESYRAGP